MLRVLAAADDDPAGALGQEAGAAQAVVAAAADNDDNEAVCGHGRATIRRDARSGASDEAAKERADGVTAVGGADASERLDHRRRRDEMACPRGDLRRLSAAIRSAQPNAMRGLMRARFFLAMAVRGD